MVDLTTISSRGVQVYTMAFRRVAPGVTDDLPSGFERGSRWVDTVAGKSYICVDDTAGAAVWQNETVLAATLNTALTALTARVTAAEAAATALTTRVTNAEAATTALALRVTALEGA